jgi:hypothetical protein
MKSFVLEKTKYLLNNSWFGLLLPAGVHQLLSLAEKNSGTEKQISTIRRHHPAEFKISRQPGSKAKP